MKTAILTLFFICCLSTTAKAERLFKCESSGVSNRLVAQLRFNESGANGYLELDDWSGYPPVGLIYGNLHETSPEGEIAVFLAEQDRHNGRSAEIKVPKTFADQGAFDLELTLLSKEGKPQRAPRFRCVSF